MGTQETDLSKRIVFSFDERSYESLIAMKVVGKYKSLADVVRDALQITRAIPK
jgi:Arc/MetJ-type ribon-helix-helix transcriptional regulator